jgi:hypothetical protein
LLKNNYLENPALLMVKDVKDVDEIWKRLKEAYGDCKILLSNKVSELDKVAHLSAKNNDPETVLEGLSSIIHLMKDLMFLAEEHSIEERLFHGSAMEKIQELMGDGRFTRWLAASCEKDLSDEKRRWTDLVSFLEKEVKGTGGVEVKVSDFLGLDICCSPTYLALKMGSLSPQLARVAEI